MGTKYKLCDIHSNVHTDGHKILTFPVKEGMSSRDEREGKGRKGEEGRKVGEDER